MTAGKTPATGGANTQAYGSMTVGKTPATGGANTQSYGEAWY